MDERIQIDTISQQKQPNFNYDSLFNRLRKKHPTAYNNFSFHQTSYPDNITAITSFIKLHKIKLQCKETTPLKLYKSGTFSYKVSFDNKIAVQLNRKSQVFNYYGLKSYSSAFEKGIEKSFEIIEHLLTGKAMPDLTKNR
jgi:hypothetical protein